MTANNIEKVKKMIMNDHWITIRGVAIDGISNGSCQEIFFECFGYETSVSEIRF